MEEREGNSRKLSGRTSHCTKMSKKLKNYKVFIGFFFSSIEIFKKAFNKFRKGERILCKKKKKKCSWENRRKGKERKEEKIAI